MNEDKLTRGERIRLEALAMSVNITAAISVTRPTVNVYIQNAETIEKWLKAAREDA